MSLSSDREFAESIADVVALVARGDLAAFEIPGQTTVEAVGQRRFQQTYEALAEAARAQQRTAVLRWVFDAPGSPAAQARSVRNAERLAAALEDAAKTSGALPPTVRVQFAKLGPIPAALQARLAALGVEVL